MDALESFSRQIEARLSAARREPDWQPAEIVELMAQLGPRREQFEVVAPHLIQEVVRPRMEAVASNFSNAKFGRGDQLHRSTCWFGYCDRFPANTKVEIVIEHDEQIDNLIVRYELYMLPVFLKLDAHDKLVVPLDEVDEQAIAAWVESKLLDFMDVYLRIDRGHDDLDSDVAVDPVCGMRISGASIVARTDYRGHPYSFCSEDCRRRFEQDPLRFVRFETA